MVRRVGWLVVLVVGVFGCLSFPVVGWGQALEQSVQEQFPGQADFDEALRLRVTAQGIPDLNVVIDSLQSALDKGLGDEDAKIAGQMLSDALMERATTLMQVVNTKSIRDDRVRQILNLVVSDLRRVLASDNPPAMAHFMLGRLMALPGNDPHEARRLFTKYLDAPDINDEQRAEALILRGQVQTNEDRALADFDKAIELAPDNGNYSLIRAVFLRNRKKFDEALAAVNTILERSPEDANAFILRGEVYRQLEKLDEALESFSKAIELAPQAPGPYQNRGEIYRQREQYDKAIDEFTKVLELQPGSVLPLVHRSEAYLLNKQLPEALADVEAVLEKDEVVAASRLKAEILSQMGRLDEAIKVIEELCQKLPNQTELKTQLALYHLLNKEPQEAISAYDDILLLDAENFLALRSRGDAYLNLGKHAEAIADFEHALRVQPEDTTLLNNLAWVLATSPDAELRNGARAVELATKACELTEYKMPHILSTLAAAFAESGNFDTAVEWSQKAVDLEESDVQAQLEKELASYQNKQPWRERQTVETMEVPAVQMEQQIEEKVPGETKTAE